MDDDDNSLLLANWHTAGPMGDIDGSGYVDDDDLSILLAEWNEKLPGNDPLVMHATLESYRRNGGVSLCDIGHQGLLHDKASGLVYNRARMLHPRLGRFLQRDPAAYADGMSLYEYLRSAPPAETHS